MFPAPPARSSGAGVHTAIPPHVLLLLPDARTSAAALLSGLGGRALVTLLEHEGPISSGLAPVDVAVLHAERLGLACSSLLRDPDLGLPELVFVVDEASSPQHFALRSRGFRHIVAQADLPDWLPSMLPQLVSLARARRILLDACGAPAAPADIAGTIQPARRVKLHAAETSFRSVFMRALLAEHGSRRRAAEEAGVPYRSFCEMLRKLGI